jgi:hypothetical protein
MTSLFSLKPTNAPIKTNFKSHVQDSSQASNSLSILILKIKAVNLQISQKIVIHKTSDFQMHHLPT